MKEQNLTTTKKKKWLLPAIIAIIVVVATILAITIYNLPANRRDRQLALAEKYMSELNYEAAILAYKAAIEIDPKCEDAYIELLDLYIVTEAYNKAEEVIAQAENNLDDEIILAMREKTNTLLASADTEADNKSENTNQEENETTTEATTKSESYLRYMQATSYDSEGNVTSIKKEEYDTDGNIINTIFYDVNGTAYRSEEYQYDNNDNLIMSARYDENKNLTSKTEYDSNGNQLSAISYDENGDIEQHTENTYDENGNRIKYVSYFSDGNIHLQYKYAANGILIESISYDEDRSVTSQRTCEYESDGSIHISELTKDYDTNSLYVENEYFYDSNWNILKEINLLPSGEIYNQIEYVYNNQNLINKTETDPYSNYIYMTEYQYYEDGTIKSETFSSSYDGEPLIEEVMTLYSYDEFGNRIESFYNYNTLSRIQIFDKNNNEIKAEYYINGELNDSHESRYDEYGNIVYYTRHSSDSFIEDSWSYEYDNDGNIISMREYIDTGDGTHLNQEYKYEYDENGNKTKYTSYYNNPELDKYDDHSRSVEYKYDENGNLIKETWYYRDNTIFDWTEYEYIYE